MGRDREKYERERYYRCKEQGICVQCRKARAMSGKTRCEECAAKSAETYLWYKEHGICPLCKKEKASPNRTRCEECAAKEAERAAKHREKMPVERKEEVEHINYARRIEKRRERAKNGLCASCGKPYPESTTFGQCRECRNKRNRMLARYRDPIPRSERPAYGMCYICGKPLEEGAESTLCRKCLEIRKRTGGSEKWKAMVKAQIDRCFSG